YHSYAAPPTSRLYTLSLHDALPISRRFLVRLTTELLPRCVSPTSPIRPRFWELSRAKRLIGKERSGLRGAKTAVVPTYPICGMRSEEHTSELQSRGHLVCRLLLEKK